MKFNKTSLFVATGLAGVIGMMITLTMVAVGHMSKLSGITNEIYNHPFVVSNAVREIETEITSMHRYMKDIALAENSYQVDVAKNLVRESEIKVINLFSLVRERFLGEQDDIETAYKTFIEWEKIRNEVIALKMSAEHLQAAEITKGKGAAHVIELYSEVGKLLKFAEAKAIEFKDRNLLQYGQSIGDIWFWSALLIMVAIIFFGYMASMVAAAAKSISESESRFRELFEHSPEMLFIFDATGERVKDCNQVAVDTLLYSSNVLKKLSIVELFSNSALSQIESLLSRLKTAGVIHNERVILTTSDGRNIPVSLSGRAIFDDSGKLVESRFSARDISNLLEAEEKLLILTSVFKYANEGIMVCDSQNKIVDVNDKFSEITGFSKDDVIGRSPNVLSSKQQNNEFYQELWKEVNSKGVWAGEILNRKKNGETYPQSLTISTVADKGVVKNYIAVMADITHLKEAERRLKRMSHHDALTGLPNRYLAFDRLEMAIKHVQRYSGLLSIVFIDLDGFKAVNDNYGHKVGDEVLIHVSEKLQSELRAGDTLARIGGDEFLVIVTELDDRKEMPPILDRYLHVCRSVHEYTSASIGVSYFEKGLQSDPEKLIEQADTAMYKAKQLGKNRYIEYSDDLTKPC